MPPSLEPTTGMDPGPCTLNAAALSLWATAGDESSGTAIATNQGRRLVSLPARPGWNLKSKFFGFCDKKIFLQSRKAPKGK